MNLNELSKDSASALIVVDQQYDFEPGGALAVPRGDEIVEPIADLMMRFSNVIVTQDFHPAGHISFASSYAGKRPFEHLRLDEVERGQVRSSFSPGVLSHYLRRTPHHEQILWPDHCVQGTRGAEINRRLPLERAQLIIRKGTRVDCDSYSTFFENDGTSTGLSGFLRDRQITRLVIVGLAGDYCVAWSSRDAKALGFEVWAPEEFTRNVGVS
jgi:nicotinamidase/pyrazinamidase